MIADSGEEFCQRLRDAVRQVPGWEIAGVAMDGNEAVSLLQKTNPDILLLDLLLPNLDGISVLRRAAEMKPAPIWLPPGKKLMATSP